MNHLVKHIQGHAFIFNAKSSPDYSQKVGWTFLAIFAFLEYLIGPRWHAFTFGSLPVPPPWLRILISILAALVLVRILGRQPVSQIGVKAWRDWSVTEVSYLLQAIAIALLVFGVMFAPHTRLAINDVRFIGPASIIIATNLLWGGYQELIYRGILQTELVRRMGIAFGVLISNLLFTFGPLHFYHFRNGIHSGNAMMILSILSIGFFFGVLFQRSKNLAIVSILHGIGDCFMNGLSD